ncbi:MAG: hypothetical protein IPN33_06930 [Saprospiraceae bacterium]|nr:hypothetical protein [Saprospiraceae bacterium]
MKTKICAYCGEAGKLTNEHIWPQCIIERVPSYTNRYSEAANKVFKGDLIIKDVCSKCNNGPLSKLDSYLCKLYDQYFQFFPPDETIVNFSYEYNLLFRSLLKISFNAARSSNQDSILLSQYKRVILGRRTNSR